MATYTENYNLKKPTYAEPANVKDINENMDKVDEIMHSTQVSLADAYDLNSTYNTGDKVMYEKLMYKCLEDGVTGAWDSEKWERTTAVEGSGGGADLDIYGEASGTAEASFSDGAEASLVECEIGIVPTQDLHGYSKPWAGGANFNKFNEDTELGGLAWATGQPVAGNDRIRSATYSAVEPSTTYYLYADGEYTGSIFVFYYQSDYTFISYEEKKNTTLTTPSNAYYIKLVILDETSYTSGIALNKPSSETSYTPYSNICPISGHNSVTVTVASTSGGSGDDYTVSLGATYYGSNLDVTTGELEVTWGNIASYAGETLTGEWLSSLDEYSELGTPTTGAQVVYELATPQTFNLTPTQVLTLLGQNYVSHDGGGTISLVYIKKDSTIIPNPAGAEIPLTGLEINGEKFKIESSVTKNVLYTNTGSSNPETITLDDDYTNYDILSFRFFRNADSIPDNSVYVTIDTQMLEINQTISFMGWASSNEFVLYKLTDSRTLTRIMNGSNFLIKKVAGIKF